MVHVLFIKGPLLTNWHHILLKRGYSRCVGNIFQAALTFCFRQNNCIILHWCMSAIYYVMNPAKTSEKKRKMGDSQSFFVGPVTHPTWLKVHPAVVFWLLFFLNKGHQTNKHIKHTCSNCKSDCVKYRKSNALFGEANLIIFQTLRPFLFICQHVSSERIRFRFKCDVGLDYGEVIKWDGPLIETIFTFVAAFFEALWQLSLILIHFNCKHCF